MTAKSPRAVKPAVILALVLAIGVGLKIAGLGLGGGAQQSRMLPVSAEAPATPAVKAPQLPAMLARRLDALEAPYESVRGNFPALQPSSEPLYTASAARDPLQHQLPAEAASTPVAADAHAVVQATPQTPESPPIVGLQGVFWGGAAPTAIINGKVYRVGDSVSGATIQSIDRQGIALEFRGAVYLMTMQGTTAVLSRDVSWR